MVGIPAEPSTGNQFVYSEATYPARSQCLPSFWLELFGVFTIEVFAAVHGVWRVANHGFGWN